MAKAEKTPKTEKTTKVEKAETYKYGIDALAKELGIEPASVRVRLRNAKITRTGKAYGWNSRTDFEDVVKKLKPAKKEAKPEAKQKKAA